MTKRNVSIVVGMAAGSEAKGKLVSILAPKYQVLVRTGSVNAAHTTYVGDKPRAWHLIPCGALHAPGAWLVLGAGAQISVEHLMREIDWLKSADAWVNFTTGRPRLVIDPNATIIEPIDIFAENGWADVCGPQWYAPTTCEFHEGVKAPDGHEKAAKTCEGCNLYPKESLHRALGSTTHGSGYNLIRKLARVAPDGVNAGLLRDKNGNPVPKVKTAMEVPELQEYIRDTAMLLNEWNDAGLKIMLEGTQGSALSMHHSGYWPKSTSRDCNASNWLMEAGLSPATVDKVYGVTRTFPIRVFGNSGPLGTEITWEDVTRHYYDLPSDLSDKDLETWLKDNNKKMICEITTATKRRRRVFMFSESDFLRSMAINRPDELMLSFVDYLSSQDFGKTEWNQLSRTSRDWITSIESKLGVHFKYLSTGPLTEQVVVR